MINTYKYNLMKTSTPSITFQSDDSQDIIDVLETFFCQGCLQDAFEEALDDGEALKDNDEYIEYLLNTHCGKDYFLGVNDYE